MSPGRKKASLSSPPAAGEGGEKGNRKARGGRKSDPKSVKPPAASNASKLSSTKGSTSESDESSPHQLLSNYKKSTADLSSEMKLFLSRLSAYGICRACIAAFQLSAMKKDKLERLCVSNFFKFIDGITDATRFVDAGNKVLNLVTLLRCSVSPTLVELKIMKDALRNYFGAPAQISRQFMSKKFTSTYKRQIVNFFVTEMNNLKSGENITDAITRGSRLVWKETRNHSIKRSNAYQIRYHNGEGQRKPVDVSEAPKDLISDAKICESALMFSIFPKNTIWCPTDPLPKKKGRASENNGADEVCSVQSENETLTARLKREKIFKNRNTQRRETLEAEGKGLFKKDTFEERSLKVAKSQAKAIGKQAKAMDLDSKLEFLKFAHQMGMTKDEIKPLIQKTIKRSFESSQSVGSISDSDGSEVQILDDVVSTLSNDEPIDSNNDTGHDHLNEDILFDDAEADPLFDNNEDVYVPTLPSSPTKSPSRLSKNQLNHIQQNISTSVPASATLKTSAMKVGENLRPSDRASATLKTSSQQIGESRPTSHPASATLKTSATQFGENRATSHPTSASLTTSANKLKTMVTPDSKIPFRSNHVGPVNNPYKKSKQSGGVLHNQGSLLGGQTQRGQTQHDVRVTSSSNSALQFRQSHTPHANDTSQGSMDDSMERFMSMVPLPSDPLKQPSHVARSDSKKSQNDSTLNKVTFYENQRRIAMASAGWQVHKPNVPIDLVDVDDSKNDAVHMSQVTFRGNEDYGDGSDLRSVNSEEYDGKTYEEILHVSQYPVELSNVEFVCTKRLAKLRREGKERPGAFGYPIIETCGALEQCNHKFLSLPVVKGLHACSICGISMHSDCCLDHPTKKGEFLCPPCNSG